MQVREEKFLILHIILPKKYQGLLLSTLALSQIISSNI